MATGGISIATEFDKIKISLPGCYRINSNIYVKLKSKDVKPHKSKLASRINNGCVKKMGLKEILNYIFQTVWNMVQDSLYHF